jgi:Putative Flp pilus-assembly TadE/G-like
MRGLTNHHRDDQGVGTIFIVLAMLAVIVGAAFATDVGRYVFEARRAQNSADATVLALATDCARTGSPIADYSAYRKSGQTINPPVCGSGQATITVTKPVSDGLLLKRNAGDVQRSATARWGTIGTATTIPITISNCEFSLALLNGTTDITLYLDDAKPQSGCSSLPGGFSQLVNTDCAVTVSAGGTVPGDPGGDLKKQIPCITNPSAPALPHDVLIPMYNAAACAGTCKGHGPYPILGFAMFHVSGYSFNGAANDGTLGKKCPDETRGKYCIRGDFIKFVTSQGTPGPSTDFGTTQVFLFS